MASGLIIPGRDREARGRVERRILGLAAQAGPDEAAIGGDLVPDKVERPWTIDLRWVVFSCGCRAERMRVLAVPAHPGDPIIFRGLPEQAVYDSVCHFHGAGMNKMVRFSGFSTFDQWKRTRKHLLMGRTTP